MIARSTSVSGRFARYSLVGLAVNIGAYFIFLGLLYRGISPTVGTGTTYVLAVAASYITNRKWSYGSTARHKSDMPRYLLAYGIGLMIAMGSMYFLSFLIPPAIAQVLVICITAIVIFTCLEVLRFGREI